MNTKTTRLAHLLLWGALVAPSVALAQTKVAVIDVEQVMSDSVAGKRAQGTLKKILESRQTDFEARRKQLARDREALEKDMQSGKAVNDAQRKKLDTLQRAEADLQKTAIDNQREFSQKERELRAPIEKEVRSAVVRLAKESGAGVVVDRTAVHYMLPELDLTPQVIAAVNAVLK